MARAANGCLDEDEARVYGRRVDNRRADEAFGRTHGGAAPDCLSVGPGEVGELRGDGLVGMDSAAAADW